MIVLGIDTSTRWAGVGLIGLDGEVHERTWRSEQNHGRELLPAIEEVLKESGTPAPEISHIAVALGPGGFSAVRVGISAALGLAMPRNTPLVGISTHSIEAKPWLELSSPETPLFSVLPAGRGELAWARFEGEAIAAGTGVAEPAEFAQSIAVGALICGESAEDLIRYLPGESFVGGAPPTRSPATLINLALDAIDRGEIVDSPALRPIYARPPSISTPRPPR